MRIYYWIHHTGEYEGNSGVQRVVRNLAASLQQVGHDVVPVAWSQVQEAIVHAGPAWLEGIARYDGPALEPDDRAGSSIHIADAEKQRDGAWLLMPEVPHIGGEDAPSLAVAFDYARFHGLRTAALFYDLIPLRHRGYESLARQHELYVRSLVAADVVLPISRHAGSDLQRWWEQHAYDPPRLPPVRPVLLPAEIRGVPRAPARDRNPSPLVLLVSLGTVEPRKNQVAVMRAVERIRARRPDLELRLDVIGNIHPSVAAEVAELGRDRAIHVHEWLPDDAARDLLAAADASVFVSLYEGFGLPVAESLWLGTPCLCSDHGPMAEVAVGGGCLTVPANDSPAIEAALERLVEDAELREDLTRAAAERPLATWEDYAHRVTAALEEAPELRRLVAVGADVEAAATIDLLHWNPSSRALLPGAADAPEAPRVGAGDLTGGWAVVAADATRDDEGLVEIMRVARGLGLRVALEAEAATSVDLCARADVVAYTDDDSRDRAFSRALRELPRTVTLRDRFVTARGRDLAVVLRRFNSRITAAGVVAPTNRVYYWVNLTVDQPFNTGVQRVARQLAAALVRAGVDVVPVRWDGPTAQMRGLTVEESAAFAGWNGPVLHAAELPPDLAGEWLLIPEITVPVVPPESNVVKLGHSLGMRTAAIFYDIIPAKTPENYPPIALEQLEHYWRGFADVDVALPISWTVGADLVRWLDERALGVPRVVPCPLAGDTASVERASAAGPPLAEDEPLRLLAIGTWEPRKNYPRLLRAVADAQGRASRPIHLTIVGRHAGFDALDEEIERLGALVDARLLGHVSDEELQALHQEATATVFASWEEGYGLPVTESLWRGLPCICHDGSAMAELVPGGGVLAVDMLDEGAIAGALARLADDSELRSNLSREALERGLRTWDEYAADVRGALSRTDSPPGWSLATVFAERRPLLTCAITTYNRAAWLRHSLPRLLEVTRPWRDVVEVVVCDNASTDETADVVAGFRGEPNFVTHRNRENVGMLGNLAATAQISTGAFVWLLGDDDLLIHGALENVLEGIALHPDVEMAYMNYAYTTFDDPAQLDDVAALVKSSTPIADGGPNRYVSELREISALNENLFTAIYTCAFRRDHALRAYQLDTRGAPFTSLLTCVPSSVYSLAALQDRPAWWVGDPALVVNMNVSWARWALLWHLERMPDLFEAAELERVDTDALDRYRLLHLREVDRWLQVVYFEAEDAIRANVSLARLIERSKHLEHFRNRLPAIRETYERAWREDRVMVDPIPPDELFARYGL